MAEKDNTEASANIYIATDYKNIAGETMGVALMNERSLARRIVLNVFNTVPTPEGIGGSNYEVDMRLTAMAAVSMDVDVAKNLVGALNRVLDAISKETPESSGADGTSNSAKE
jgi:hypothetical protein